MTFEKKIVSMRKCDCSLNATQVITPINKTVEERKRIQKILDKNTRVEELPPGSDGFLFKRIDFFAISYS